MKDKKSGFFPVLKKKVSCFLLNESGKISKQSIIKLGVISAALISASSLFSHDAEATGAHRNKHCSDDSNCDLLNPGTYAWTSEPTGGTHGSAHANSHRDWEFHGSDHGSSTGGTQDCPVQHHNELAVENLGNTIEATHDHDAYDTPNSAPHGSCHGSIG